MNFEKRMAQKSFSNFQTIRDAARTPALIHKVYSGPEWTNVESQGEREGETQLLSTDLFLLSIFICIQVVSVSCR